MMATSASLMNTFHTLSKVDFDTKLVNCSHITYYTLLHYVQNFRNIVAIDQVPSPVENN